MMTGNGVMHNGSTVIELYGQNLDRLQVGDRVGVVRKDDGTLHFWVNGIDQGPAATNVPERIFGVIGNYDLMTCYEFAKQQKFSRQPPFVWMVEGDIVLRPNCGTQILV